MKHTRQSDIAALFYYIEQGMDALIDDAPHDRFKERPPAAAEISNPPQPPFITQGAAPSLSFTDQSATRAMAVERAKNALTLEELSLAIRDFDGIALKKTATKMVFAAGNPQAPVMLVGEAPGADEDRQGFPFVGVSGQLLDRMLACIGLDRAAEAPEKAVYISNILNWRPPGNRTPAPAEIELSLPFIERHIQLIKPRLLILCGGVAAQALLGRTESVSKLRGRWHDYTPVTPEFRLGAKAVPAIVTYHPSYLLRTPAQKKAAWSDLLGIQERL